MESFPKAPKVFQNQEEILSIMKDVVFFWSDLIGTQWGVLLTTPPL